MEDKRLTSDFAWQIYNFIQEWKAGEFGEIPLQEALDRFFRNLCERRTVMKATELMVGDYIMFNGSPYIIEEISGKGWVHILDIKNKARVALSSDYILDFIEGVPLTPEILKKNKFKIVSEDVYRISNDLFVLTDDSPYSLCNSFDIGFGDEYNYITAIKYVHELQHILKPVGVEKEIIL